MKQLITAAAIAGLMSLTACGGKGDDKMGDNVEQAADNQADSLEAQADNLEDQADAVRDAGKDKEEAIDDADINAQALNGAQQAEVANRM